MFDYDALKTLAKTIGQPVKNLLALSPSNDPFYAGVESRVTAAEWFAGLWPEYGVHGAHLRRIHYRLVSAEHSRLVHRPDGRAYENTENDWTFLCTASLTARYLGLVPFDGLIDRRNDEPMIFAEGTARSEGLISCQVLFDEPRIDEPEMPTLPALYVSGFEAAGQDFIAEVWIEKSTQNDWLVPLCQRRGVNLVVGIGEQSETRSRELALRSDQYGVPVRIIYISDFDPGGRSMPKAVARKVEFTIAKFDLNIDLQLIPLALTPDQCRTYNLPRTPIKDTERRKDKFEQIFGVGATELDALEALHPGELARLLNAELDNWLDVGLQRRVDRVQWDLILPLRRFENAASKKHAEEIQDLKTRFEEIVSELAEWQGEASEVWREIAEELEEDCPDFSGVEIPRSEAPGRTDKPVLFDSRRSYVEQMDFYNAWRAGDEGAL